MNTSDFMDKQILGLSAESQNTDIFDIIMKNPPPPPPLQEEQQHHSSSSSSSSGMKKKELKEEILPSYDFQPIRPPGATSTLVVNLEAEGRTNFGGGGGGGGGGDGTRVWNSADSKTNNPSIRNYGSLDASELAQTKVHTTTVLCEVDQTMKKHADNLLHAIEGVSARLSQMESRTRNLESSVDDLKLSFENNHGSSQGKLRQLENMLREVQTCVQVLRDKQEVAEAQEHLAKLQAFKGDQQSESLDTTAQIDSVQQATFAPQQSHQLLVPQTALQPPPQSLPAQSPPNATPPQQYPPQIQLSSQLPQNQIPSILQREPYFPPPGQIPESTQQQYQLPPSQQTQPPPPAPHQQYAAPQLPHYSQPTQLPPQQHPPVGPVNPSIPQLPPPTSQLPEETPYHPSQSYTPNVYQSPSMNQAPTGGPPPPQQFYGAPAHMYESQSNRPGPGFSSGYGPNNFSESYPYSGSSSHYGGSPMKPPQVSSSPSAPIPSGGGSYPRLPTAQILPQALPTASSVSGGSSAGGTGNRVPIDDVVDKVVTMGFSRDQVRATVRKLTENGQSVDLNVVLDKLMNDGGDGQPQKNWFGR